MQPFSLSFCRDVSPTRDRAERELVNIVLWEKMEQTGEIIGERKQGKWKEKTFK